MWRILLGNPCTLLSPLNSFIVSMLTSQGFPFSYTSITSANEGAIFLIILYGPAHYDLNLSQLLDPQIKNPDPLPNFKL